MLFYISFSKSYLILNSILRAPILRFSQTQRWKLIQSNWWKCFPFTSLVVQLVQKYPGAVKTRRILRTTGFPSCGGREGPRRKSISGLVPTSEPGGDNELRSFVSETYVVKKQVGTQRISKARIRKNWSKTNDICLLQERTVATSLLTKNWSWIPLSSPAMPAAVMASKINQILHYHDKQYPAVGSAAQETCSTSAKKGGLSSWASQTKHIELLSQSWCDLTLPSKISADHNEP